MVEKSDTLKHEAQGQDEDLRRKEALTALHRLREIGEKLPAVDAAAIVCEGRNLAEQGSH